MGRFSSVDKLRFQHTYRDNGGVEMTQVCDLGRLCTLYGRWLMDLLTDDDFREFTLKRGLRVTTVTPAKRAGR